MDTSVLKDLLILAITNGEAEKASPLLKSVTLAQRDKDYFLGVAALQNNEPLMVLLMENGANPTSPCVYRHWYKTDAERIRGTRAIQTHLQRVVSQREQQILVQYASVDLPLLARRL
ncbi:MAG: hypothetical protein WA056_02370 [Gallionella sp.]